MKIGILTFHSQLNYGGVLQCWALKTALEKLGHEVVVIDRLMEVQLRSVRVILRGWTLRRWVGFVKGLVLRRPESLRILRHIRTVQFAKRHLNLTRYSFRDWSDAPKDLGVDLIVVGSDQVWNPSWDSMGIYMLEGAPNVPAIGYAISLGVTKLPFEAETHFRVAASRFSATSAREASAAELLRPYFGEVAHVVDPVLLVGRESRSRPLRYSGQRHFVGYFIKTKLDDYLPRLQELAERNNLVMHLLVDGRQNQPKSGKGASRVKWHLAAGPMEFVKLMANCDGVFTDSFHAVMYAHKYGRPLAVLKPTGERVDMFGRIEEFVEKHSGTSVIGENILDLVNLICRQDLVRKDLNFDFAANDSLAWIEGALR